MNTRINSFRGGGLLMAALLMLGSTQVFAATAASTDVTNTATVTFRTAAGGTTDQTGTGDTDSFVVDRLVNLTVTGGADVDVVPGQTGTKVRTFEVTNSTNGPIDLVLSTLDDSGDTFDLATGLNILHEAGAGGVYAGDETDSDWVDNLTAGATITVHVVVTEAVSGSQVNGDTDGIYLKAQASDPASTDLATANTNAITADTAGADTAGTVDNVVNDGDGNGGDAGDAARDGAHSALRRLIVRTAQISLVKSSSVVYDPVNCSVADGAQDLTATCAGNAKRIPGARIVYKLAVINADTAQNVDATLINISDTLDADTTYVAGSLYRIASTEAGYAAQACYSGGGSLTDAADNPDTGGAGNANQRGSQAAGVVTFTEGAGLTETNAVVYCYKVTIN